MLVAFGVGASFIWWVCSWAWLVGTYYLSEAPWGKLKREKEIDRADLGRLQNIDLCMRESKDRRQEIENSSLSFGARKL